MYNPVVMFGKPVSGTAAARLRVEIHGAVQGVGFRPFVHGLARELALRGWVANDSRGVLIEVEGARGELERFLARLPVEKPPHARILSLSSTWLAPAGYPRFEIRESGARGAKTAIVLPDLAACAACLREILDPADRRHGYPFTNCTHCGPRFTILRALPYDRPNTTMVGFAMCSDCRAEYEDPGDRRFHAQPNACPRCGPRLALWDPAGSTQAAGGEALAAAARALRQGAVVAVKGLGGFHLMCDAADAAAVGRLRERKPRREKPFAVMARDLEQARALCDLEPADEERLLSVEAPILLLPRRAGARVAGNVAPGFPTLGLMLPYTPLHHLLLGETGVPVVATSGNLTDEPIATDEREALRRLGHVADLFLVHDRPIERHVDDSVGWRVRGGFALLRRARGYAPLPVIARAELPTILAVGAHLKSVVALSVGRQVFLSQHIGDLETPEAMSAFERVIADFLRLYEVAPVAVAHDLHPDYVSTQWARSAPERVPMLAGARLVGVQHHHAHLAAALAEHGIEGRALGVTWDGTGYGTDGTVWGGEFLLGDAADFERVAHLRPFRLPGGEAAVREPWRVALALLWELHGAAGLARDDLPAAATRPPAERAVLARMLERGLNAPSTTSAGRLFDGVAALLGLHPRVSFEGQAAMALEFAADAAERASYPMPVGASSPGPGGRAPLVLDWGPTVGAVLDDLRRGEAPGTVAARFQNALVEAIVEVARAVGEPRVTLSGGCFQNRTLVERAAARLESRGHEVLLHRQVPPNDGGISLGQVAVAAARLGSG